MCAIIESIMENSIAEELGLQRGDKILSINSQKMRDYFDYQYLMAQEEVEIHLKRVDGTEEIFEIEKDFDEDLGIVFASPVFNKIKKCANNCIFCFVDQQPEGLRDSLYIKDDDYRLSALQGTYITLTNLTKEDKKRIEELRIGPLYISVHTTDEETREFMLKNSRAKDILKELKWLDSLGIPLHMQIVLCPDINDGKILDKTLKDLAKFEETIMSIAIVPVGVTEFRKDEALKPFDKEKALEVIDKIEKFNKKAGHNLAFAADEFYILAEKDFPEYESYEGFSQLEDGVGASRLLLDDFEQRKSSLPKEIKTPKEFTLITGYAALMALEPVVEELNKIENLKINIIPIRNSWGEKITVTGLIKGQDIINTISPIKDSIKNLVIPSVALREVQDDFLDGIKLKDLKKAFNIDIFVIKDCYSTEEIIEIIKK